VSGLTVWRCERCRRVVFPYRELCPHCGSDTLVQSSVEKATATEVTSHRGTPIATVDVEGTPLLARADTGVRPGSHVTLAADGGAPVATSG
jgi:uncharacterized OB-fold protein